MMARRECPLPASADHAIAVGAIDDKDSTDRSDDDIAGYSNWGPRDDDGDDDEWDELKPTVTAPGSGIMAPRWAEPSPIPLGDSDLADNEYQSLGWDKYGHSSRGRVGCNHAAEVPRVGCNKLPCWRSKILRKFVRC